MSIEKDIAVPSELRVSARRGLKTLWSPRVYIQPRGTVLRPPAPSKVRQAPVFPRAVCFPFMGNIAAFILPFYLLSTLSYFCISLSFVFFVFFLSCLLLAVMLVHLFLFYSSLLSHFIFHFASFSSLFLSSHLSVYCVLFRVCFFVSSFPYILHVIFSVLFRCPYFNANISVLLICVSFFVCVCLSFFFHVGFFVCLPFSHLCVFVFVYSLYLVCLINLVSVYIYTRLFYGVCIFRDFLRVCA